MAGGWGGGGGNCTSSVYTSYHGNSSFFFVFYCFLIVLHGFGMVDGVLRVVGTHRPNRCDQGVWGGCLQLPRGQPH